MLFVLWKRPVVPIRRNNHQYFPFAENLFFSFISKYGKMFQNFFSWLLLLIFLLTLVECTRNAPHFLLPVTVWAHSVDQSTSYPKLAALCNTRETTKLSIFYRKSAVKWACFTGRKFAKRCQRLYILKFASLNKIKKRFRFCSLLWFAVICFVFKFRFFFIW